MNEYFIAFSINLIGGAVIHTGNRTVKLDRPIKTPLDVLGLEERLLKEYHRDYPGGKIIAGRTCSLLSWREIDGNYFR